MIAAKAAFAFDDEAFSDRTLVLFSNGPRLSLDAGESDSDGPPMKKRKGKRKRDTDVESVKYHVVKKLLVSSVVLASQSPVFKAMLMNGMKESKQNKIRLEVKWCFILDFVNGFFSCGNVQVKDEDEGHQLVSVLRALYSGEIMPECKAPELLSMLLLADKYECDLLLLYNNKITRLPDVSF